VAEIGRDRLPEALFIVGDDTAQPRQPVEPLGKVRRRLAPRPHDHGVQGLLQRPQRGGRQGFVHGFPPSTGVPALILLPQAGPLWNFWQERAERSRNPSISLS